PYNEIRRLCVENLNKNPGCFLHRHWLRMNDQSQEQVAAERQFMALSWLGGGYPHKYKGQRFPDPQQVAARFANQDTLDIQSGILQFYSIAEQFVAQGVDFWNLDSIRVLEIGGGYGRLALFFLSYFGSKCHYVSVDFVPISLTYCIQVI